MGKETLTVGDIEIEKNKFCNHKSPFFKTNLYIEKVFVSKKNSCGENIMNTLLVTCIMIIKPLYIILLKTLM